MQACLKSSYLWNAFRDLEYQQTYQFISTASVQQCADSLRKLGNDAITPDYQHRCIAIQSIGRIDKTQQELKEAVFPNVAQHLIDFSWLRQREILAPRNEDVSVMNKQFYKNFLFGSVEIYEFIDTKCDINEAIKALNYPTEFLNALVHFVMEEDCILRNWRRILLKPQL
ncbi:hypothetical protein AVEN_125735-1 [Araneus ventricosus]|uniref:Uncharacterized protein n=1 Tax=Araneus ventricosus TaxID=182803 RepID=A0A4Y2SCP8_ARAVE|nr:hypothetical protein AVEN_125735-1 [Araneus ventricosus]